MGIESVAVFTIPWVQQHPGIISHPP